MGKQQTEAGEDTVWISFRIDADIVKKLDAQAEREDRSRASVIRRLIIRTIGIQEKTA